MKLIIFLLIAYIIIVLLACNLKETFVSHKIRKEKNKFYLKRRSDLELFFKNMEKKSIEQIKKAIKKREEERNYMMKKIESQIEKRNHNLKNAPNKIKKKKIKREIEKIISNQNYTQEIFDIEIISENRFLLNRMKRKNHDIKMLSKAIARKKARHKARQKKKEAAEKAAEKAAETDSVEEIKKKMLEEELSKEEKAVATAAAASSASSYALAEEKQKKICDEKKEELNELIAKTYIIPKKAEKQFDLENYIKKSCKESDS